MERIPRDLIHHAAGHLERYGWAASDVGPGSHVLDVGCGIGYGADILLADEQIATYTGLDKADVFHDDYRGTNRKFWQVDLDERRPPVSSQFDVTVCFEVLEHLQDPHWFIAWLDKVTAGVIWASVPVVPTVGVNEFHLHDFVAGDLERMFNNLGWVLTDFHYQPDELSEVGRFVPV